MKKIPTASKPKQKESLHLIGGLVLSMLVVMVSVAFLSMSGGLAGVCGMATCMILTSKLNPNVAKKAAQK